VSTAAGSNINSNDLLASTIYPDNGQPHTDSYTYDAVGEKTTKTDRNGSTHAFTYDVLGRQTSDTVTMLGAGVDGSIQRIDTAYDTTGRPYLYSSYADPAGTVIVNQVERTYNGLGQISADFQSHSGPVIAGSTPAIQYSYAEMANGANNSRLLSMTYPNGRVLNYNYNAGLDNSISRLSSLSDNAGILEAYSYLGQNSIVIRSHPQPGMDQTYVKQTGEANGDAGDQYTGLDRFGRVVDERWLNTTDGSSSDRFQYSYDRDGNRLSRSNAVNALFSEQYSYDNLNQLTSFARGTHTQTWNFDALGNWTSFTSDGNTQNRSHNLQNQITNAGGNVLAYDNNGNTIASGARTFAYDFENRLKSMNNGAITPRYDGDGTRVTKAIGGTTTR